MYAQSLLKQELPRCKRFHDKLYCCYGKKLNLIATKYKTFFLTIPHLSSKMTTHGLGSIVNCKKLYACWIHKDWKWTVTNEWGPNLESIFYFYSAWLYLNIEKVYRQLISYGTAKARWQTNLLSSLIQFIYSRYSRYSFVAISLSETWDSQGTCPSVQLVSCSLIWHIMLMCCREFAVNMATWLPIQDIFEAAK